MNKTPTLIAGAPVKLCHYAFSQQKLNGSVFFLQELKKKPGNAPPPQKKKKKCAPRNAQWRCPARVDGALTPRCHRHSLSAIAPRVRSKTVQVLFTGTPRPRAGKGLSRSREERMGVPAGGPHAVHSPRPPAEGPAAGSASRIIAALMPAAGRGEGRGGGPQGREGCVRPPAPSLRASVPPPHAAGGARTRCLSLVHVPRPGREARSRREPRARRHVGRAQQQVSR